MSPSWSRGSLWHRWDVHVHTPETGLNDQFRGGWDAYVSAIEKADPSIVALGVTDYLSIAGYRKLRRLKQADRLKNIALLFPNIEFRVSPYTRDGKAINIHFLVSPDDPDHEERLEEALSGLRFRLSGARGGEYACNEVAIERLGRDLSHGKLSGRSAYEEGLNQFKVNWEQLRDLRDNNPWLRRNCLVAIDCSSDDGTAGLKHDDGYRTIRDELHRFADIIFSGNPADRDFWLGAGADSVEQIETKYGRLKPCLHGSDAHDLERLLKPAQNRFCWIKAEPTFSGLRQVLFEPRERVIIGPAVPTGASGDVTIDHLEVSDAEHWLKTQVAEFNPGLVAIIGPKGSGKTALADMLAVAANADVERGTASFLSKAEEHLGGTSATLHWADGATRPTRAAKAYARDEFAEPDVKYLSQQFVEHLCSEDQLSAGLLAEIECVIFSHLDPSERLSASSFDELRAMRTQPMHEMRRSAEERILDVSDQIFSEVEQHRALPQHQERLKRLEADELALRGEIERLVQTNSPALVAEHAKALQAARLAQDRVTHLRQSRQALDLFSARFEQAARSASDSTAQLESTARELGLPLSILEAVRPRPLADARAIIAERGVALDGAIARAVDDSRPDEHGTESLKSALERVKATEEKLNLDRARRKRLEDAQRALASKRSDAEKLRGEIQRIETGYAERLAKAQQERGELYGAIFDQIRAEEVVLRGLYAPLAESLAQGTDHERLLQFSVRRQVALDEWALRGEDLIDQRKRPRDSKPIAEIAREMILPSWNDGGSDAVRSAITNLASACAALASCLKERVTRRDFARWLFSTEHITLEYGIQFDGVDLKNLSPGTKGIVLLILYLAIDTADRRPLVIDQPEENLDPKSVYDVLVPYFREAKKRRQIIVITHNANLVVNTDAEQVIVAAASRVAGRALPLIEYRAGALEEGVIRDTVCDVLEGGQRAFLQRERKYGLASKE